MSVTQETWREAWSQPYDLPEGDHQNQEHHPIRISEDAMIKFNSQICTTREQSERLLALGLKKETADCYYWQENDHIYGEATGVWHLETLDTEDTQEHFKYLDKYFGVCLADDEEHYFIPAWSLHRLIEMLNEEMYGGLLCIFKDSIRYEEMIMDRLEAHFEVVGENMYENVISCIEWLIKEGYFNTDYLEEKYD